MHATQSIILQRNAVINWIITNVSVDRDKHGTVFPASVRIGNGFWSFKESQTLTISLADAVDSRLVFNGSRFPSFIELDSKTFPRTSEITISFWLRVWPKTDLSYQTILYYRTGSKAFTQFLWSQRTNSFVCLDETHPVLLVSLTDSFRLHIQILNHLYDTSTPLAVEQWHHIAIAHNLARHDHIKIMINGSLVLVLMSSKNSRNDRRHRVPVIDGGGDFLVGQFIRPTHLTSNNIIGDLEFDTSRAFYGEIAFLNIWQRMLSDNELQQLAIDCHVQKQECGDAVAWMDFVNDIKGEIQIHWPSGIYALFSKLLHFFRFQKKCVALIFAVLDNCPTDQWLRDACDNYCRKLEGTSHFPSSSICQIFIIIAFQDHIVKMKVISVSFGTKQWLDKRLFNIVQVMQKMVGVKRWISSTIKVYVHASVIQAVSIEHVNVLNRLLAGQV